jgi:hypothetical protein
MYQEESGIYFLGTVRKNMNMGRVLAGTRLCNRKIYIGTVL